MRQMFLRLISFASRHLPDLVSLFFAILFFLLASGYFIEEKSALAKLFVTGAGLVTGMVGGGVLGWVVGGVGIVAMGTGVGIGALGAIVIGGTVGAVIGGLTGASFSFVNMLLNPGDFDVSWLGLGMVAIGSAVVFFLLRLVLRKLPKLVRKNQAESI
ncbi:hypothetical protein OO012_14900 [Rhodobacteraceae bacterium KMM 6894]|nr:hypothetical protein [Rhodobacteraceae bacterium KMM 6894]